MAKVDCFISWSGDAETNRLIRQLKESSLVDEITVLADDEINPDGTRLLRTNSAFSGSTMKKIAQLNRNDYALLALQPVSLEIGQFALERLIQVAGQTGAALVYADYFEII